MHIHLNSTPEEIYFITQAIIIHVHSGTFNKIGAIIIHDEPTCATIVWPKQEAIPGRSTFGSESRVESHIPIFKLVY